MKRLLFSITAVILTIRAFAQVNDVKTAPGYSIDGIIRKLNEKGYNSQLRMEAETIIPVQVHVVENPNGGFPNLLNDILADFAEMNVLFQPLGYRFVFCSDIHMIHQPEYLKLEGGELHEMVSAFNVPGAIDYFFTEDLGEFSNCGVAYLGFSMGDMILMNKGCVRNKTLAHETGHYLGLSHPHDTQNGLEFADGTNCLVAGDGICDTPAEPDLRGLVGFECKYTGTALDPKGVPYKPNTDNIMSYSPSNCQTRFTPQQFARMQAVYNEKYAPSAKCDAESDFSVMLKSTFKRLSIGKQNFVPVIIWNKSHVSKTTDLTYNITLTDPAGKTTTLVSSTLQKTFSPFSVDTILVPVPVAADAPEGNYILKGTINTGRGVAESNYDNNSFEERIGVYKSDKLLADITIQAVPPAQFESGYQLTYQSYVSNKGTLDMTPFDEFMIRTFLSSDETYSPDDILVEENYLSNMKSGQIDTVETNLSLPRNISSTPFVIIITDVLEGIRELDEENNVAVFKLTPATPSPSKWKYDIKITSLEFGFGKTTDTLELNRTYSYEAKLLNTNPFPFWENYKYPGSNLRRTHIRLYLSKDTIVSNDDIKGDISDGRLYDGGGWSYMSIALPGNITPGKYYIIASADPDNELEESDERNNTFRREVTVTTGLNPDLIHLSAPRLSTRQIFYNETINYKAEVKNTGYGPTNRWRIVFYLTRDSLRYVNAQLAAVSPEYVQVFSPNTVREPNVYFEVEDSLKFGPGNYYFVSCIENIFSPEYYPNNCKVDREMVTVGKVTGIEDINREDGTSKFAIVPNPASDYTDIMASNPFSEIKVMDETGSVAFEHHSEVTFTHYRLPVHLFREGMYFIRINNNPGSGTKKLVIIR